MASALRERSSAQLIPLKPIKVCWWYVAFMMVPVAAKGALGIVTLLGETAERLPVALESWIAYPVRTARY